MRHRLLPQHRARYVPLSGTDDGMSQEAFGTFTSRSRAVPRGTLLRDFDYLKPTLDVKAEATAWDESAAVQMHYGEHDFRAEGPGKPKATAMAEAFAARQLTFEGRGRVFAIRPGFRFTLEEHPLDSLNTEYLAVRASHYGCPAAESALVRELLGIPGTDDYHHRQTYETSQSTHVTGQLWQEVGSWHIVSKGSEEHPMGPTKTNVRGTWNVDTIHLGKTGGGAPIDE